MKKQNGATAAWVLTFDPSLKQNKKEKFSSLKPDRNTTKCVLETDKSVSSGKTRIHSKELQLSDFHLKLNVSSLAGLLWQTHKRSMLKNKSNHPEMTRSQLRSRQNVTTVYLHPCAGVCFWFVRSPCIPVQTQEFDSKYRATHYWVFVLLMKEPARRVLVAWHTCSPAPLITHTSVYVTVLSYTHSLSTFTPLWKDSQPKD